MTEDLSEMEKCGQNYQKPYYWINALDKGLTIVEFLADHQDLTVTEISRVLQMDRSTCNRFLLTLKDLGYIAVDRDSRYRVTLKLFEVGNKIAEIVEIRPPARVYMKKLAEKFNETVNIGRLDGNDVVSIDVVSGREKIRFDASIGSRSPIYTLAMGKAILAFRPVEEQNAYIAACDFKSFTPNTITDRKKFRHEILNIRERGYAVDNEEWALDIRCVAVPIFDFTDFPSHAIGVSGPATRLTNEKVNKILPDLSDAGKSLSLELGDKICAS
jgi:DNA-binding IclR family transcriptional regulator